MLGTLLGTFPVTDLQDFLDAATIEDENEDTHWASDKNRFEDWLLNATGEPSDLECYY
jgi:hypothetical protein